jgi:hypothetical protein
MNKKFLHLWTIFFIIDKKWTPIEQKITKIQIGSNPLHIITRIQLPIQLTIACIIHRAQGLTLDHLTFDPSGVAKYGLTYIALS